MADEYERLTRVAREWARIASTPQYRQMVEVASKAAREQASDRVREQTILAGEGARDELRRQAAEAVESRRRIGREAVLQARATVAETSRRRIENANAATPGYQVAMTAAALQPVLDQYIKAVRTWVPAVQRVLENEQVLTVLQTWARLVEESTARSPAPDAPPQPVTDLATLKQIADDADLGEADLASFEAELTEIDALNEMLDAAAAGLVSEHPLLTKGQARTIVVTLAYIAWLATLVGLSVGTAPIFGILAALAGGIGWDAERISKVAGKAVDRVPGHLFAGDPSTATEVDEPQHNRESRRNDSP